MKPKKRSFLRKMEKDIAALEETRQNNAESGLKTADFYVYEQMISSFEEKIRERVSAMLEMQLHIDLLEDSVEDLKSKLSKSLDITKNTRKSLKTETENNEKYLKDIKDEKEINKALVERI
jgi:flagellar biosynthesis chaperone FliJ